METKIQDLLSVTARKMDEEKKRGNRGRVYCKTEKNTSRQRI
jgi:hypothetical protein